MSASAPAVQIDPADGRVTGPRGAKAFRKWEPKEWRPEYEAMVALSCTGLSNEEVGKRFGYGKQQVSNICNTTAGKRLKEIIKARLRQVSVDSAAERMTIIQENAMKNIETIMADEDDRLKQKTPLALFDRSLALLKTTGVLKGDSTPTQPNGQPLVGGVTVAAGGKAQFNMLLSPEAAALLSEGTAKADMVKKLHGNPVAVIPKP